MLGVTSNLSAASLNSVLDVPVPVDVVTAICSPCVIVASWLSIVKILGFEIGLYSLISFQASNASS